MYASMHLPLTTYHSMRMWLIPERDIYARKGIARERHRLCRNSIIEVYRSTNIAGYKHHNRRPPTIVSDSLIVIRSLVWTICTMMHNVLFGCYSPCAQVLFQLNFSQSNNNLTGLNIFPIKPKLIAIRIASKKTNKVCRI